MKKKKKLKQAVIYARWSPRKKSEMKTMSAVAQLAKCEKYCDFHELDIIAHYKDEGLSGKSANNRPEFQQAMALACKKKAVLVVYSLSRFARSVKDAILYSDQLNKSGADLASISESIDTSTPMQRFFFTVMSALNQFEREQTAEYTSDIMLQYQSCGRRMSARVPYGWGVDPNDAALICKDQYEQTVIKRVLRLRGSGMSHAKIGNTLFSEGFFGRRLPLDRRGNVIRTGTAETRGIVAWTIGRFHKSTVLRIIKRAGIK